MTDTAAAPRPARPARAPKPQGQWKIDGKLTLNHNEEFKLTDDALNVRQRILDTYSKEGFASIPSDDLSGRMRWWGLYTQRRQGLDGSRTSKLEADELGLPAGEQVAPRVGRSNEGKPGTRKGKYGRESKRKWGR